MTPGSTVDRGPLGSDLDIQIKTFDQTKSRKILQKKLHHLVVATKKATRTCQLVVVEFKSSQLGQVAELLWNGSYWKV